MGQHLRVSGDCLRGDESDDALCESDAALRDSCHHPRLLEYAPAADTVRVSLVGDWRFHHRITLAGALDRAAADGPPLTACRHRVTEPCASTCVTCIIGCIADAAARCGGT